MGQKRKNGTKKKKWGKTGNLKLGQKRKNESKFIQLA